MQGYGGKQTANKGAATEKFESVEKRQSLLKMNINVILRMCAEFGGPRR